MSMMTLGLTANVFDRVAVLLPGSDTTDHLNASASEPRPSAVRLRLPSSVISVPTRTTWPTPASATGGQRTLRLRQSELTSSTTARVAANHGAVAALND